MLRPCSGVMAFQINQHPVWIMQPRSKETRGAMQKVLPSKRFLMTFMGVGGSGASGEIPDGWESSSDTKNPCGGWDQGHMVNHQRCGYEIRRMVWGKSAEMCGNPVGSEQCDAEASMRWEGCGKANSKRPNACLTPGKEAGPS